MQFGANAPFPKDFQMRMPGQQPQEQEQPGQGMSPEQMAQFAQMGGMPGGQVPPGAEQDMLKNMTDEQLMQLMAKNPQLKKEFDKLLEQHRHKFANKTKPFTNKEYLECKNIEEYFDKEGGLMIEPTPGLVFKTKDAQGGKFFFNVVTHEAIDRPEEKYLVDMDNQQGLRIPMSFGQIREAHDKKGEACKVTDVVVSPYVLDIAKKEVQLNVFLKELLASFLEQKYKVQVDPQMTQLKMTYKGDSMEFQRVKGKKAPKIQQLSEENAKTQEQINKTGEKLIQEMKEDKQPEEFIPRPKWELYVVYHQNKEEIYDGDFIQDEIKCFKFAIEMPLLVTGKFISLEVNPGSFYLKVNKFYELILKFPINVNTKKVKGFFNSKERKFYILAPPKLQTVVEETTNDVEPSEKQGEKEQKVTQKIDIQLQNEMLDDLV